MAEKISCGKHTFSLDSLKHQV